MYRFRVVALLGLPAVTGCFVDDGQVSQQTTAQTTEATSTETTATGLTTEASGSSESSESSESSGSTTGTCMGAEQVCEPGDIEEGENDCGFCGVETRVCIDGCRWSGWVCYSGPEYCGLWFLPDGDENWRTYRYAELGADGPFEPVQAAFSLRLTGLLIVLTQNNYFVLETAGPTWIDFGPREELFPELGEATVTSAITNNVGYSSGGEADVVENLYLSTAGMAWRYTIDAETLATTFDEMNSISCCENDPDWASPSAPLLSEIQAAWYDPDNTSNWYEVDLSEGCEEVTEPTPLAAYRVYLATDGTLRLRDWSACFGFLETRPFESPPFQYIDAPPAAAVGGLSHLNGVYVVPEAPADG